MTSGNWKRQGHLPSTIFYFLLLRNKNEEDHIGNGFNLVIGGATISWYINVGKITEDQLT